MTASEEARYVLMKKFFDQYKSLMDFISHIQMNGNYRSIIAEKFDTAFLWTKEAINCIDLKDPPVANEQELLDKAS